MTPVQPRRRRASAQLCVTIALLLAVPLGLRALDARFGLRGIPDSYLLALEGPRQRAPFDPWLRDQMQAIEPGYVALGDSMGGTRLHTTRLCELSGEEVLDLFQAGSGPVFWYLALKNWVLGSGMRPKVAFVFFRDTNLTDVMYRLDEGYRWNIDRVAGAREDEVNAVLARRGGEWRIRMRNGFEGAYGAERVRLWMVPGFTDRMSRALVPSRRERKAFVEQMNARFDFMHNRPTVEADLAAIIDRAADFHRDVDRSVLPLMLRDAKHAGVTLCFVRVQRRPVGNQPPPQGPRLRQYIADLEAYVKARGAVFRDDTGDPLLTLEMYDDGDHLAESARARYTEILYERVRHLLP